MDIFIEKIVAKRKTSRDTLFKVGIVIAGIILSFIIMTIPIINSFAPILIAAVLYFGYYFIRSTNLEFEYAVTNGDIDVDKIIAQRKRKRIFSAMTKDIEIIAKLNSDKFASEFKNIPNKIAAVSSMESQDIYFLVAPYKGQRTILFFEPDQRMIDSFKTKIPRKVFEN